MKLTPYKSHITEDFVGRTFELNRISEIQTSAEAAIIVVWGRRRVGKTALIEKAFAEHNLIKFEGIEGKTKEHQIQAVLSQLAKYTGDPLHASLNCPNWRDVFKILSQMMQRGRWTLYLEELQWLANYNSELISDLKYYWDNAFRHNPEFRLVLCGSSPSFMVGKVLESNALYNRSMYEIPLKPFTLSETREYLGDKYPIRDVMDTYIAIGGIPEYLRYLRKESSILTGLCKEAFSRGGFFTGEAKRIFVSNLASNPAYEQIIEYLGKQRFASRDDIVENLSLSSGGGTSDLLYELERCGFIYRYTPYYLEDKSKLVRYAINDYYLQFYYKFIKPILKEIDRGDFNDDPVRALPKQSFNIWQGYAFERYCRSVDNKIAAILGFASVKFRSGVFFNRKTDSVDKSYQFDLIFERNDRVCTLCEIKYTASPVGTEVIDEFERKLQLFQSRKKARIERVLISAAGTSSQVRERLYFDRVLTVEDLV